MTPRLRHNYQRMTETARTTPGAGADMPADHWVEQRLPPSLRPYARLARLDRPIGTWLLLLPGWWSLELAGRDWTDLGFFVLFGLGAVVMRGAGCVWNDVTDREFDRRVARTRARPIASGAVSVVRALLFMALLLAIGLAILMSFNRFAIALGAASLALIAAYPLMKRITDWPQIILGLTFNWGALLGWAAITGGIALEPVLLYLGGVLWTLGYDTIYAHQDKEDDALIGIKSSALALGARTRSYLFLFYGGAALLMAAAGAVAGLGWPYHALLLVGLFQLVWQAATVDLDDPADCLAKFRSNRIFGLILLGGIALARALGPAA
ncbi:MAG: 4-hydroxybenzoate octaprenyltransferase [Alphaproteobacteria bacterium]